MKTTEIKRTWQRTEAEPDSALNGGSPRRTAPAAEDGDVRWERVARLKAAIENGTYRVSSEALAERLIEHMLRAGSQRRVDDVL